MLDAVQHPDQLGIIGHHLGQAPVERRAVRASPPIFEVFGSNRGEVGQNSFRRYAVASASAYSFHLFPLWAAIQRILTLGR